MKILHKTTGTLLNWAMNNYWFLVTLNILLPIAIYFEAGPVSAFTTYFGFFLVASMAMSMAKDNQQNSEIEEALKSVLKDKASGIKTTEFETDEYSGSITSIHEDDLPPELREILKEKALKEGDMPEELKELLEKHSNNEEDDEPTKH